MTTQPLVLVITGPTAVGKTDLAMELAERLPAALISVDSAMVYRGMDIGTAKPAPALLRRHPHALIDIREPSEPYSAADFVAAADRAVREALAAGRLPLLVGGTMLYLRAFREGLAALPPADPTVRAALVDEAAQRGWPALYRELTDVDPDAARGIHPHNHVRLQRALEVHRITGKPISHWWKTHAGHSAGRRLDVRLLEVALQPTDRSRLAARIDQRFRAMLEAGLVDEVRGLRARHELSPALPSMRSVGYRQVWQYLEGDGDLTALAERGAAATRSLAKRQLTWLRRWTHVVSLPAHDPSLTERVARQVQLELS